MEDVLNYEGNLEQAGLCSVYFHCSMEDSDYADDICMLEMLCWL